MPAITPNNLRRFRDAWVAADLDPTPVEPIQRATADLERLAAEHRELTATQRHNRRDIVGRLADGDIDTLTAVIAEREVAAAGPADRDRISKMYRDAVDAVARRVHTELAGTRDELITRHLAPAWADAINTITENADLVRDVRDENAALTAGGKTRTAWFACVDAVNRIDELKKIVSTMSQSELLPKLPRGVETECRFYAHPDRIPPAGLGTLTPVHRLIALIDAGTEPGIYTVDEAAATHDAIVAAQRAERHADVVTLG